MRLTATAFALLLALPGCAGLSSLVGEPTRDVFELLPQSDTPRQCGRGRVGELVIELPKASSTLDTQRIMIRPSPLQVQYLPDAQWGDTVPVTLQTLLVRNLGQYDAFTNVGRAPLGAAGNLALISEITDFSATVEGSGAVVRLAVDASMVREADARVVARGRFAAQAAAPSTRTEALVPAFDLAAQDLVRQMTAWGLGAAGVRADACR